jgi:hypothetical protein
MIIIQYAMVLEKWKKRNAYRDWKKSSCLRLLTHEFYFFGLFMTEGMIQSRFILINTDFILLIIFLKY